MGKRSHFDRNPRDYYRTFDPRAVAALLPHLALDTVFAEPCAGDGVLVDQLTRAGHHCALSMDISPDREDVTQGDVFALTPKDMVGISRIITNPPWSRPILHAMIEHMSALRPTWCLFDADWKETKQSARLIDNCKTVVAVGRLKWIEGTKMDGKDNAAWYLFDAFHSGGPRFVGRTA